MKIAVFGTGSVGTALAGALVKLGHDVGIGTRDPQATLARSEAGPMGGVPFAEWHAEHSEVTVTTFAEAAAGSGSAGDAGPTLPVPNTAIFMKTSF
jgi:8-hydroxy-5-deazaflavin:NADPH oxidoreductase